MYALQCQSVMYFGISTLRVVANAKCTAVIPLIARLSRGDALEPSHSAGSSPATSQSSHDRSTLRIQCQVS